MSIRAPLTDGTKVRPYSFVLLQTFPLTIWARNLREAKDKAKQRFGKEAVYTGENR